MTEVCFGRDLPAKLYFYTLPLFQVAIVVFLNFLCQHSAKQ